MQANVPLLGKGADFKCVFLSPESTNKNGTNAQF